GKGRLAGLPRLLHDLHALGQRRDARPDVGEAVAVGTPLVLVPARADAHLDAPARDVVDRRGDLREVGGVAVAHARAHLPEAYARGARGEGRHEGPRLVGRLVRGLGRGVEVVVDPDRLERRALDRKSTRLNSSHVKSSY